MNTKKWKMRSGEKIRIKDMGDSHLMNAIRMLERVHNSMVLSLICAQSTVNGEMAQYSLECEERTMEDGGPEYSFPIYGDMVDEAMRRGLKLTD